MHDMSTEMLANKMVDRGYFASALNYESVIILPQKGTPASSAEGLFHRIAKENHLSLHQENAREAPSLHQFCTDSKILTNSSMHCLVDSTTSLSRPSLPPIRSTLLLPSHLGDALITFDYWTQSQNAIPKQRCFVDSVKWLLRKGSDSRLEVRVREETDDVIMVLSCTPAVFRFIPLHQPVREGEDALFLPTQTYTTVVSTMSSSVVPLTPLALVPISLSCFLEQQTTRFRAVSPDISGSLPVLLSRLRSSLLER